MTELNIKPDKLTFAPGEIVGGEVNWNLGQAPSWVEVRLFWFTRGKGTTDTHQEAKIRFDNPASSETRRFELQLPVEPYSYNGHLIAIVWALELSAHDDPTTRVELVMSPTGKEIVPA